MYKAYCTREECRAVTVSIKPLKLNIHLLKNTEVSRKGWVLSLRDDRRHHADPQDRYKGHVYENIKLYISLESQRTLLPGTWSLRSLLNSSRYCVIVSMLSDGAKSPSGLAAKTDGSSGTLELRKDCRNSFMRFQQSPGTTHGQYSTWESAPNFSHCRTTITHLISSSIHLMTYFHRYASGTGAHRYCADFYQEVTVAVPRAATLHLVALGILEVTFQLHHENVKVCVSYQTGSAFK